MATLDVPKVIGGGDFVKSASGKVVRRGEVATDRAPEIQADEIEWKEKIGGGCFGSVYKGRCRGIDVAVKKLLKQDLDVKVLEDFRKEVDILTQMRHPNVILFMGACTEPGKLAIVCELLTDSVSGILKKYPDLSMFRRVQFARDTASGMAWLHGAKPQIIHRDLKPQNLLVDENWSVKVCDFGLSQVKLAEEKIRDGKSIPGTPLWMAPEVLLGKDVDEKCDVYSFGIVLWEILSGKEPFPHMDSYGTFKRAITKEHERPEIPENLHPKLKDLMRVCWHPDPKERPSFEQLIPILDSVLVDVLVDDEEGTAFWKSNFLGRHHVGWGDFQKAFATFLRLPAPNAKDQNFTCLKKILAEPTRDPTINDTEIVRLEKFGHLINWFGPIVINHKGFSILDKIRVLMQKDWFHGDITKETAEDLLAPQSKGAFLVRTSVTDKSCPFTISKMSKNKKINHQRIVKRPNGTFELTIKFPNGKVETKESKDDFLVPFIASLSGDLGLDHACPGSRYRALFLHPKLAGYLTTDDD